MTEPVAAPLDEAHFVLKAPPQTSRIAWAAAKSIVLAEHANEWAEVGVWDGGTDPVAMSKRVSSSWGAVLRREGASVRMSQHDGQVVMHARITITEPEGLPAP